MVHQGVGVPGQMEGWVFLRLPRAMCLYRLEITPLEIITLIENREATVPITVAGWDYSISQNQPGITWNNLTQSLEIDSSLAVGNYYYCLGFK